MVMVMAVVVMVVVVMVIAMMAVMMKMVVVMAMMEMMVVIVMVMVIMMVMVMMTVMMIMLMATLGYFLQSSYHNPKWRPLSRATCLHVVSPAEHMPAQWRPIQIENLTIPSTCCSAS